MSPSKQRYTGGTLAVPRFGENDDTNSNTTNTNDLSCCCYDDTNHSMEDSIEENEIAEDVDVAVSSPRRSSVMINSHSNNCQPRHRVVEGTAVAAAAASIMTPTKSRRLFWDAVGSSSSSSDSPHTAHLPPPVRRHGVPHQPGVGGATATAHHPFNVLNDSVDSTSSSSMSSAAAAGSGGGVSQARRKRTSAERAVARGTTTPVPHPPPPLEVTTALSTSLHHTNTTNSNSSHLYASPRISPNSFLTMDGRFVHSKNPFSSPMMTDTPTATPLHSHNNNHHHQHQTGRYSFDPHHSVTTTTRPNAAPSLPGLFTGSEATASSSSSLHLDNDVSSRMSLTSRNHHHQQPPFLPKQHGTPVTEAMAILQAVSLEADHTISSFGTALNENDSSTATVPSTGSNQSNRRCNNTNNNTTGMFTCSPIPEHGAMTTTNQPGGWATSNATNMNMMMMESTDVASAGSLHKVRRIHRSDDVVAATGYHLTQLAAASVRPRRALASSSLDTFMADDDDDDPTNNHWNDESPTDVQHFFPKSGPPPTPMKPRPVAHPPPYSGTGGHHHHQTPHDFYTRLLPRTPHAPPPLLPRKTMNPLSTPYHHHSSARFEDSSSSSSLYEESALSSELMMDSSRHAYHHSRAHDVTSTLPRPTNSRFHADFDIIGELGRGSFGNVYKVLSRLDGCMYAIKKAHRQAKGTADRDRMLKEVYALAALSDQADTANFHIVRYHQAWIEDDRLYIQTELCSRTLGDEIDKGLFTVSRTYKLLREILLALDFIHRHNMVHLDIKPDNIFLKNDQYKLGDFGLVTKLSASQDVEEGDSRYMSMELLSGDGNCDLTKSDVFSLGATMYELCMRRPLPMNGQEWQDIRAGRLSSDLPNLVDFELANIIRRMMDPVAFNRPSPSSLLEHPQLLSDEQKALHVEKTKVIQANLQLAAQQQRLGMATKRQLTRANTWNGSSLPYM